MPFLECFFPVIYVFSECCRNAQSYSFSMFAHTLCMKHFFQFTTLDQLNKKSFTCNFISIYNTFYYQIPFNLKSFISIKCRTKSKKLIFFIELKHACVRIETISFKIFPVMKTLFCNENFIFQNERTSYHGKYSNTCFQIS